jgi:hypothetical protein
MRAWSIEIWLLDDAGNEVMPNVFEKAVYNLHPSFEKNKHGECAEQILSWVKAGILTEEQSSRSRRSASMKRAGESST